MNNLIEQLESIKNAMSKQGTTNVNQVNNDLPFILDLSVFNDTYNGRYESLVEQIPNNDNLVNVGTYVNDNYKVNMLYSHNLFDKDNANVLNAYFNSTTPTISQDVGSRTIYIPCKPNTTYTISKTITNRFAIGYTTTTPALNVSVSGVIQNNSANSITITTGDNATHLVVFMWISTDTKTYTEVRDSLMINEGSEALPYEPYIVPSINVDGEEIYNANLMNYSTNEVVVGKWIDGKKVYRKVVSGTTTNTENTWGTLATINNLDIVTKIDFNVVVANNEKYTNNMHNINFYNDGTNLKFRPTTSYWVNKPITAIIEYTKTTD